MRITKRQLIRIIKETHPDYQGLPQSDVDYYELADDYAMWVKENGHVTPAASSVMATYFLEKGLEGDHEKHEMLGKAFGVEHNNIMADIRRQEAEKTAMMGESLVKITKKQLRRIIKEEKAKLLNEMKPADMSMQDAADYYENTTSPEAQEAIEELVSSPNTRMSFAPGAAEDEVYIMTGASEGITVKVLRRGR